MTPARTLFIWVSRLSFRRIVVTKTDLEANPHAVWNAFLTLITDPYRILTLVQRRARLVFLYHSEIYNGGHLQFFLNRGGDTAGTIEALETMGAFPQAQILRQASARWASRPRPQRNDVFDYSAMASEGEFDDLDDAFYGCQVQIDDLLKRHLEEHETAYIIRR